VSKITQSARGRECQIRIPKICNGDNETVVWCHANGVSVKGIGQKSLDILGSYGCFMCHNAYDRRIRLPLGLTRDEVELCFWQGHARSLVILDKEGLL